MDFITTASGIVSLLVGLMVIAGWSHSTLRARLQKVESEIFTEAQVRQLILDKLEPTKVEYQSLVQQISELKSSQRALDMKLEKIIQLLAKIETNGKN